jgi:hypothetical protein
MGFDTIIVNGRVATATDTYTSDVAISDGKISAVGQSLPRENAGKIIDAAGRYVFPGGIDVHTHLDMPFGGTTSADDFETGTRAAAFRRNDNADRFRHPVQRPDAANRLRHLDAESFRQSGVRLRLSLHHYRSGGRAARRDERPGARRHHQLQAVSWPIPACLCSTMPASSKRCARRQTMADWSACTQKTAA